MNFNLKPTCDSQSSHETLYHALFACDVVDGHFSIFQRSHDFVVVENFVVAFDVRTKRHSGEWNLRETTNSQNFLAIT
jgi:hypothetical protein